MTDTPPRKARCSRCPKVVQRRYIRLHPVLGPLCGWCWHRLPKSMVISTQDPA